MFDKDSRTVKKEEMRQVPIKIKRNDSVVSAKSKTKSEKVKGEGKELNVRKSVKSSKSMEK